MMDMEPDMKTLRKESKSEALKGQLRKRLLAMTPGDGFLSIREIMREFAVSQITVTKALDGLCADGLLRKGPGGAVVVADEVLLHRGGTRPTICLAMPRWESEFLFTIANIFSSLGDKMGFRPEIAPFDSAQGGVPPELPSKRADGLLLAPPPSASFTSADMARLDAFERPLAVFGRSLKEFDIDCVYSDDAHAGALAASHLLSFGHRKLAAVASEPECVIVADRINAFVEHASLHGVAATVIDCGINPKDLSVAKVYIRVKELLACGGFPFTGLFVVSSASSLGVLKAIHEAGLRIPQDVNVISCNGNISTRYCYPALTVVNDPYAEMVEAGVKTLMERIAGDTGKARKLRFLPELVKMESTGPVKGFGLMDGNESRLEEAL